MALIYRLSIYRICTLYIGNLYMSSHCEVLSTAILRIVLFFTFQANYYISIWQETPILIGYRLIHKCITHEKIKRLMNPAQATSFRNATGKIDYTMTNDYMFRAVLQDCYPQSDRTWQGNWRQGLCSRYQGFQRIRSFMPPAKWSTWRSITFIMTTSPFMC